MNTGELTKLFSQAHRANARRLAVFGVFLAAAVDGLGRPVVVFEVMFF